MNKPKIVMVEVATSKQVVWVDVVRQYGKDRHVHTYTRDAGYQPIENHLQRAQQMQAQLLEVK